jgi:hypothetical protein
MANPFEHPSGAHTVLFASMSDIGYQLDTAGAHTVLFASMSDIGYQLDTAGADSDQHALPLFLLSDTAATRARPLQHLQFCAMLFPIVVGGIPLLARVNCRKGGYGFGGVSHGKLPALLHQSLTFAAQRVGHHKRLYQTAFITSTSLQILLLVLRPASGRTLFLTLQNRMWTEPSDFRLESGLPRFLASTHAKRSPPEGHRA